MGCRYRGAATAPMTITLAEAHESLEAAVVLHIDSVTKNVRLSGVVNEILRNRISAFRLLGGDLNEFIVSLHQKYGDLETAFQTACDGIWLADADCIDPDPTGPYYIGPKQ